MGPTACVVASTYSSPPEFKDRDKALLAVALGQQCLAEYKTGFTENKISFNSRMGIHILYSLLLTKLPDIVGQSRRRDLLDATAALGPGTLRENFLLGQAHRNVRAASLVNEAAANRVFYTAVMALFKSVRASMTTALFRDPRGSTAEANPLNGNHYLFVFHRIVA